MVRSLPHFVRNLSAIRAPAYRSSTLTPHAHRRLAGQANITINFDVVRLPGSVYYNTSNNDTAARVIYLMDTMGYDCVAGTVFIQPPRMQFMRYVISHQPYGYQVVTTSPIYNPERLTDRLFKWSVPFTRNLWCTILCSIVASAAMMTYFEHETESACLLRAASARAGLTACCRRRGLSACERVDGPKSVSRLVLQRNGRLGACLRCQPPECLALTDSWR